MWFVSEDELWQWQQLNSENAEAEESQTCVVGELLQC